MRITQIFIDSFAALLVAGLMVPASANAWPVGKPLHLHPEDSRIVVRLCNEGELLQDVKVDGKTYTALRHESLVVKARAGTLIYAESTGFAHRKGDLLVTVTPEMQGATISIK
jgi:hypothetical protein